MKQETFKNLDLEKQVELYNEWLIINHLDEYVLYPNDEEGIECCFERNFFNVFSTVEIVNELTHSTHYDISDTLVMYDRDIPFGFKSLTDSEIKERFENQDFLDWLDGVKGGVKHE